MSYGNHFLDSLAPDDEAALRPHLRAAETASGQVLIEQDGPIPQLHFPVTAQLVNLVRFSDGSAVETAVIGREGLSGLAPFMAGMPCGWEVSVRAGGGLYVIAAEVVRARQGESATLRDGLLRLSHVYQMQAVQHAACNARHKVLPRVARWLLLASDLGPGVKLQMTQEELGGLLGAQRTTVNDAASQLKAAGAIRYARGVVSVLDRGALEGLACECYAMERRRIEAAGVMP
ncbi:MAG: Crp/Fnr family transcriptional regulator [Brevundimonas sp.]|uniref:Crp/Fnr family transcriptional regulator n=1 Tax=Brevundimonas sp. TaxID=1871086 RepID=UPI003919C41B